MGYVLIPYILLYVHYTDYAVYAFAIAKLQPPVIPFMPLLLKGLVVCTCEILYIIVHFIYLDTTFISEGNETYIDGLVNFEKMVNYYYIRVRNGQECV